MHKGRFIQLVGQEVDRNWEEIMLADIVLGLSRERKGLGRVIRKKFS
jgi:hypothetical protein